ncbi:MAG TPA: hypothetical protein VG898_07085 [Solirubrobacterales bacterium]|nr:hypothetical protein [Solirubrobacterales bacterium]
MTLLLLAVPGGAVAERPNRANPLEVPRPAVPMRDVVLGESGAAAARTSASASTQRDSLDDGSGATIAVSVTQACAAQCNVTDPQRVADFIGTLIHGEEVDLLTVQLDTEYELGFDCGFGAEACYFTGENKIVIGGYEEADGDGATFDFVLAHEYGHHVAQHREMPAPFGRAIDWGPERWASLEGVCQGERHGRFYPGDEGDHYFEDPGEAFAESFARYRFPDAPPTWRYSPALLPNEAAFQAIREDTLSPWQGRTSLTLSGRVPARGEGAAVESLRTPLDGLVSLRPRSLRRHGYELALRSRAGRLLRRSRQAFDPGNGLAYTVCGARRLRLIITSTRSRPGPFRLQIQRP